jgi:hypothetical protein
MTIRPIDLDAFKAVKGAGLILNGLTINSPVKRNWKTVEVLSEKVTFSDAAAAVSMLWQDKDVRLDCNKE